jgi:hypothetical protein
MSDSVAVNRIDDDDTTTRGVADIVNNTMNVKQGDIDAVKQNISKSNQKKIQETVNKIVDKNTEKELKKAMKQGTRAFNDMSREAERAANDANRGTLTKGLVSLTRGVEDGFRKTRRGIENVGDYTGVNSLGSRSANYLGSTSSNSVTQKKNVRSRGPGKKITITFIQDDRNQCFIKDYNLCNVSNVETELSNVYDDKLVIDGNNKPVKSNIQNIGKNQTVNYNQCDSKAIPSPVADISTETTTVENAVVETTGDETADAKTAADETAAVENVTAENAVIENIVDENADAEKVEPKKKGLFPSFFKRTGGYNASKSITRRKSAKPMSKRLLRYSRRSRNSRKF